jgi:hypothetical protein
MVDEDQQVKRRRLMFVMVFALACLAGVLFLQGCATEYTWKRTHQSCGAYEWKVVPREALYMICGTNTANSPNLGACVSMYPTCVAYSYMSEERAKRTMSADGETLWEHEQRHVMGETHK